MINSKHIFLHKFDIVSEYVQIIDWALCKSDEADEVLSMDVCSDFIQFMMIFVLALTNDNVK